MKYFLQVQKVIRDKKNSKCYNKQTIAKNNFSKSCGTQDLTRIAASHHLMETSLSFITMTRAKDFVLQLSSCIGAS